MDKMGKSSGITTESIGHGQKINRAFPPDNQWQGVPNPRGGTMRGNCDNIGHSLTGAKPVNRSDDLGLAGSEDHQYIPNH